MIEIERQGKRNSAYRRSVVILLVAVLLCFACNELLSEISRGGTPKGNTPVATIEYTDDGDIRELSTGFRIENSKEKEYGYYNTAVEVDDTKRLVSYVTGEDKVEFDSNYVSNLLVDAVKYKGRQIIEKTYFTGDMKTDVIDYDSFSVAYEYDGNGEVKAMTVDGDVYEVEKNRRATSKRYKSSMSDSTEEIGENGSVTVKLNGRDIYEYETDEQDRIVREWDYVNNVAYGYKYVGEVLTEVKKYRIFDGIAFNYETVDVVANNNFDFENCKYGYGYKDSKYITQLRNADKTTYYSYLNDKLTTQITDGVMIEYILDGEIKYSGLVYGGETYFYGYDTLGRINSILDEFGYEVVRYYFTATGEIYGIDGMYAATLGRLNSVLYDGSGIYDHNRGVYYTADGVYDPKTSSEVNYANKTVCPKVNTVATSDAYLQKSPVNKHTVIHDRVMQIVSEYFAHEKVEVGYGLYVQDALGDKTGIVDIYTLPYEIAPFSCGNLLNGNQVYDVVYNTEAQLKNAETKMSELIDKDGDKTINYFASYKPLDGTMNISGEFVFLGNLIRYYTVEHGIIVYEVLENNAKNYSGNTNVYDYDNSIYLLFNKPDYEIEMFKGVRLIAGVNQEYYDNVQEQLDVAQANAQLTIEKINAYEDPAIYNTNDKKNIWDRIEIPEGQTLVFDENGEPHFEPIPEPESGRFWKAVALGVAIYATIVVTTVITIATVGCGTPIVAAVCTGALIGIGTGFAIGAATGAAFEVGSALVSGEKVDWDKVCTTSLEFAVECAVVGGVTGALAGAGAAFGGCFVAGTEVSTPSGAVEIEDVQAGDKVMARNDKTGEVEEKEVTKTFEEQAGEIVKLTVDDEVIETTTGHPVYAEHRGYVAASQLRAGDILVDVNGEKKVVEKIQHEILEKPITVYNLEVADDHNYYVGKTSVLVHNFCGAITPALQYGRNVAALSGFVAATGIALTTVIELLDDGTLTWQKIYANDYTDETDNGREHVSDIDWDLPRPKLPDPESPKYRFAYVEKGASKLHIEKTEFSLIEASIIIVIGLSTENVKQTLNKIKYEIGKGTLENFAIDLVDQSIEQFIQLYSNMIYDFVLEQDSIFAIGFYTEKPKDARKLMELSTYILDITGVNVINSHHDDENDLRKNKEAVQYKHYHVKLKDFLDIYSEVDEEIGKKLSNYHLFYGSRVK